MAISSDMPKSGCITCTVFNAPAVHLLSFDARSERVRYYQPGLLWGLLEQISEELASLEGRSEEGDQGKLPTTL